MAANPTLEIATPVSPQARTRQTSRQNLPTEPHNHTRPTAPRYQAVATQLWTHHPFDTLA